MSVFSWVCVCVFVCRFGAATAFFCEPESERGLRDQISGQSCIKDLIIITLAIKIRIVKYRQAWDDLFP